MPLAGFEPTIPASKRPQTHALDRAANWNRQNQYDTLRNELLPLIKHNNTPKVPCALQVSNSKITLVNPGGRAMAWVCGHPLAGIACSKPAGGIDVCRSCCVCCQAEFSASGWSTVQGSCTECGVSECDGESSTWGDLGPRGGGAVGQWKKIIFPILWPSFKSGLYYISTSISSPIPPHMKAQISDPNVQAEQTLHMTVVTIYCEYTDSCSDMRLLVYIRDCTSSTVWFFRY